MPIRLSILNYRVSGLFHQRLRKWIYYLEWWYFFVKFYIQAIDSDGTHDVLQQWSFHNQTFPVVQSAHKWRQLKNTNSLFRLNSAVWSHWMLPPLVLISFLERYFWIFFFFAKFWGAKLLTSAIWLGPIYPSSRKVHINPFFFLR